MATDNQILDLIGHALQDATLMTQLKADPMKAARAAGIELTAEQATMLKAMDAKAMTNALTRRSFSKDR